jgi:dephospho-CoA kinase
MLRVGLTGGIACGKSHVLARLASRGIETLDLDGVAHEVLGPQGAAYDDVVQAFGREILSQDGSIDRKRLGAIVFADPLARERLNGLMHPSIRAEETRRAQRLSRTPGALFVTDAALLVEAGSHLRFDRLVVVHCEPAEQLRRLSARDGLTEAAARARLLSQMPIGEKRRFAHVELDTSGTLAETHAAADRLAEELRRLAAERRARVAVPIARAAGVIVNGPARGPRGLDPARLLDAIVEAGGVELERLARLLSPPCSGPWYRAARADEAEPGAWTLAGPLVLWALARAGDDRDFLVAAAASLARLTHGDAARVSEACLTALALQEALVAPAALTPPPQLALAEKWGGAPVPERVLAELAARLGSMLRPEPKAPQAVLRSLERLKSR